MPSLPLRVCSYPLCPDRQHPAGVRCPHQESVRRKEADERRGSPASRGYDARWRRVTAAWRREDPKHNLCVDCLAEGRYMFGPVTDHIVPHKGDPVLFWDRANWAARCKSHHDRKTAREDGGFGNPIQ